MKQRHKRQLAMLKSVRGVERKQHFEQGGSLVDWRGGTHTVTVDRKKRKNKRACRGRVQWEQ